MKGIESLPCLKKLVLKTNKMEAIDFVPDLPKLEHLDLGENQIAEWNDIKKL
jgi:Leucine-rich repeat (LRR) protein